MESDRFVQIEKAVQSILEALGENAVSDEISKTPGRVARWLIDLTSGYYEDPDQVINNAYYPAESNDMVLMRNIRYSSICEHHLMPFFGEMHVAYIPNTKLIGLSKIPRLVNMYARRLQIQERLTAQIAHLLYQKLHAQGVAVIAIGTHSCTLSRGVRDCSANLVSTVFLGKFDEDKDLRSELFELISVPGSLTTNALPVNLYDV